MQPQLFIDLVLLHKGPIRLRFLGSKTCIQHCFIWRELNNPLFLSLLFATYNNTQGYFHLPKTAKNVFCYLVLTQRLLQKLKIDPLPMFTNASATLDARAYCRAKHSACLRSRHPDCARVSFYRSRIWFKVIEKMPYSCCAVACANWKTGEKKKVPFYRIPKGKTPLEK